MRSRAARRWAAHALGLVTVLAACLVVSAASAQGVGDSYGVRDVSGLHIAIAQRGVPRARSAMLKALSDELIESVSQVTGSKSFRRVEKRAGISAEKRTRASALRIADQLGADYVVTLVRKKLNGQPILSVQVLSVVEARRVARWKMTEEDDPRKAGAELAARVLEVLRSDHRPVGQPKEPIDLAAASTAVEEVVPPTGFVEPGADPLAAKEVVTKAEVDEDDPFAMESAAMGEVDYGEINETNHGGALFQLGGMDFYLDARARFDSLSYFEKRARVVGENKVNGRTAVDVAAGGRLQGDAFAARARLLYRNDFADPARRRLEPEELTLSYDLDVVKFLAGRTLVTWGRGTLVSAVDVISPLDGRDFLNREKLPVWVAEISSGLGPIHADLLILPFFPAPLVDLPEGVGGDGRLSSRSRWIDGEFPTVAPNGRPITYAFGQGLPRGKLSPDLQAGLRLSTTFWGIDAALSYVNQRDPFPSSRATITTTAEGNSIATTIDYYRRHVIGLDLESTAGRLHLIGEAALVLPSVAYDPADAGTLPHIATVFGFDVRSPYFLENHEVRFFLEAAATLGLGGAIPNDPEDPSAIITRGRFPFPLALFARLNYSIGSVTMGLTGISNFAQFVFPRPVGPGPGIDLYLRPEVQVLLWHRVSATAGLDYLVGGPGEFFGGFRYNTRFSTTIQVQY